MVLAASTVTQLVDNYYQLVNEHHLTTSWSWLTPAYQESLDIATITPFGNRSPRSMSSAWTPQGNSARLVLRYVESSGTVSVEDAVITFVQGAGDHQDLIGGYQVT